MFVGWGTQFFGGPASDVLMEVAIPIWTQASCRNAFTQRITSSVMCAGAKEGGRDSCQVNLLYKCCLCAYYLQN